jgi:hypothetical protein
VKRALLAGANPNVSDDTEKATALHKAASIGSNEIEEMLIAANADPLRKNVLGMTYKEVHEAFHKGYWQSIENIWGELKKLKDFAHTYKVPDTNRLISGYATIMSTQTDSDAHLDTRTAAIADIERAQNIASKVAAQKAYDTEMISIISNKANGLAKKYIDSAGEQGDILRKYLTLLFTTYHIDRYF